MRSKLNYKVFVLCIIILTTVSWFILGRDAGSGTRGMERPPVAVRTVSVARQDVPLALQQVGTVVPYESVGVRSRLDSQLTAVKFRDGDYVTKGDLLFVLDDRTLKAQLNQQQSNLARDRAQLANLRQQYERNKALAGKGFESAASLDDAKAAYDAQHGTLLATEAAVQNLKVQLEYTRITAPISGRTGTINITVGNTVKANDTQALVTINQVKPIRVQVSLPQRYLDAVRQAMATAAVNVVALRESGGTPSLGTLEYIDNAVDQSTGTFIARASFANADESLWPGMFVKLNLMLGEEKNAITVPEVAVQRGQDEDFVFIVQEGKALKRPITVVRMEGGIAVIEKGLQNDENVVVDGLMSLTDGAMVSATSGISAQ